MPDAVATDPVVAVSPAGVSRAGRQRYGGRVTGQTTKLYIFPHAGGSAQYYAPFAQAFSSSDIKRIAVQYPGRNGTHDLPSFTSIPDLADQVWKMLSPRDQSDGKVAFFGHSMGALLAFEVAHHSKRPVVPLRPCSCPPAPHPAESATSTFRSPTAVCSMR